MSENQITLNKYNDLRCLFEFYLVKLAHSVILGWLGEMDEEMSEEDWT